MHQKIPEVTSKRMTALRFLLAILVVFIHNNFTVEGIAEGRDANGMAQVFNQSLFGKWVQLFISGGIATCAVPLFFVFAAYLQIKKNNSYRTLLKKRVFSLVIPCVAWFFIYFCCTQGLKFILTQYAPHLLKKPSQTFLLWTKADWIKELLGYTTGEDFLGAPILVPQFWFVRDIFILTVLSPIVIKLLRKFPVVFLTSVSILYLAQIKVYFVETQALFFYSLGLCWATYDICLFETIDNITWTESITIFLIAFFVTYQFYSTESILFGFLVISACILALKLSNIIVAHERIFLIAARLSVFSFFLFAIHNPVLNNRLERIWLHFFPMKNAFFCLFEYFGVNALTIIIGTGIGIALRKICPPLFALLNGGRK